MDEGGGARAGCIRIRCPSPRRIMTRWFSPQGKVKGKKTEGRMSNYGSEDGHGVDDFSDSPPRTVQSELQRREFLFSIGVSCYLLHVIATGREEIHKILELRNDLEKLLKCHNDELKRKQQEFAELRNDIDKFLECHKEELRRKQQERSETSAYSAISDVVDGPDSSTDHYYSPQISETSMCYGREGSLKHYVFKRGEQVLGGGVDQLEAELEAEFELLQIGENQEGKRSKLKGVSEEGFRFGDMCVGHVEEQQGVCPYELERRLHEVMETRQEEEIKELESALEDAKQRLQLKENEAAWWKDTAYIVSEHIPEPSRITPTSRIRPYPLSR